MTSTGFIGTNMAFLRMRLIDKWLDQLPPNMCLAFLDILATNSSLHSLCIESLKAKRMFQVQDPRHL